MEHKISFCFYFSFHWRHFPEKFIPSTLPAYAVTLVAIRQQLKALYLEDILTFWLHLGFRWRELPETSYLTISQHAEQQCKSGCLYIGLPNITLKCKINEYQFTWRTNKFHLYLGFHWKEFPET